MRPAGFVAKRSAGKVVLGVEEVGADGGSDEVRDGLCEQQGLPAEKQSDRDADGNVNHQRDQAIEVLAWIIDERIDTHPVNEHEHVSEQDRERMADELIFKALA